MSETRRAYTEEMKKFLAEAEVSGVVLDTNERWEQGIPHHPRSQELMDKIVNVDWLFNDDMFDWKQGGDGDNGESLMYLLDIIFEMEDKKNDPH